MINLSEINRIPINLIEEFTLPTVELILNCQNKDAKDGCFFLKDPVPNNNKAVYILNYSGIDAAYVNSSGVSIKPVMKLSSIPNYIDISKPVKCFYNTYSKDANQKEFQWAYLEDNCFILIKYLPFRKIYRFNESALRGNDYDKSQIKEYLSNTLKNCKLFTYKYALYFRSDNTPDYFLDPFDLNLAIRNVQDYGVDNITILNLFTGKLIEIRK